MIALEGNRRLYRVVRHGAVVGSVRPPGWRSDGAITVGDATWTLTRTGRSYAARGPRSQATGERTRSSIQWDVVGSGGSYRLESASGIRALGRQWRVLRGGAEIGRSDVRGFWTPRAALVLPDDVPPLDQAFLLWLVQDGIYRRTNGAAASLPAG